MQSGLPYTVMNFTVISVTGTVLPLLSVLGVTQGRAKLEEIHGFQVMALSKCGIRPRNTKYKMTA